MISKGFNTPQRMFEFVAWASPSQQTVVALAG
jgi:hypothetical protein